MPPYSTSARKRGPSVAPDRPWQIVTEHTETCAWEPALRHLRSIRRDVVSAALDLYRGRPSLEFSDCLVVRSHVSLDICRSERSTRARATCPQLRRRKIER